MNINEKLFDFIEASPNAFFCVDTVKKKLIDNGYAEISLGEKNKFEDGGKYFVTKNGSSLIAFRYKKDSRGFMISASHTDSPSFRYKSTSAGADYTKLNVEKYGGMIYYSWLDRPLSLAGRVALKTPDGVKLTLVNFDSDTLIIPSVAIHLNRAVNDGYKFNPATDMLPLMSIGKSSVSEEIANKIGVKSENILATDLFLYVRERGRCVGKGGELLVAPRLDDLECVFASLEGFLSADNSRSCPVLAVFDNEEVGSETKQGAASTFLNETLSKVAGERYLEMLDASFMISADNAHAKHPNHPELSDPTSAPILGGGVVVKHNANQRYTTDAYSAAIISCFAEKCGIKLQNYSNRADMLGGSTLGSISNTKVSIPTVDIGLAQLAMHSAVETAAASDLADAVKLFGEFYSSSLVICKDETKIEK